MNTPRFNVRLLEHAQRYIESLPESESGAIIGNIKTLQGYKAMGVRTKQLNGPLRELIVGNHRVTYFKLDSTLYFVRGFRKKTNKTPRQEIEYAQKIYKQLST